MDGISISASAVSSSTREKEDDFFESWSKPSTPKSSTPTLSSAPSVAKIATPPVLGRTVSSASATTISAASTTSSSTPRTITSISARSSRLGAKTLTATASTSNVGGAKKTKSSGLGAQKTKPVDFAAAEKKAKEEEQRIRQLGYDREREEQEEKARREAEEKRKVAEIGKIASMAATSTTAKEGAQNTNLRLGFGALPGKRASPVVAAGAPTSKVSIIDDAPTTARDRFGNQKAISSDMYFERNAYDSTVVREGQTRLQSFQGATSISSDQYFGREEEEGEQGLSERDGGLLGDGSLSGFENAAKDVVNRLLANPDVQNMQESIRTGALKLSDYLAQMSMDR